MTPEQLENLLSAAENAGDVPLVYSAPLVALGLALGEALASADESEDSPELDALIEAAEAVTLEWTAWPADELCARLATVDPHLVVAMNEARYAYLKAVEEQEKAA